MLKIKVKKFKIIKICVHSTTLCNNSNLPSWMWWACDNIKLHVNKSLNHTATLRESKKRKNKIPKYHSDHVGWDDKITSPEGGVNEK